MDHDAIMWHDADGRIKIQDVKARIHYSAMSIHMKDVRKRCGLTQSDVAIQMGVSLNYYTRLENGKEQLTLPRLIQFISLTGASADEIVAGSFPGVMRRDKPDSLVRESFDNLLNQCSNDEIKILYEVCSLLSNKIK